MERERKAENERLALEKQQQIALHSVVSAPPAFTTTVSAPPVGPAVGAVSRQPTLQVVVSDEIEVAGSANEPEEQLQKEPRVEQVESPTTARATDAVHSFAALALQHRASLHAVLQHFSLSLSAPSILSFFLQRAVDAIEQLTLGIELSKICNSSLDRKHRSVLKLTKEKDAVTWKPGNALKRKWRKVYFAQIVAVAAGFETMTMKTISEYRAPDWQQSMPPLSFA